MKTNLLLGKNIMLRCVVLQDVDFILELRTDSSKTQYLHTIEQDREKQIQWILEYKEREKEGKEYYFVIESKEQEKLGLVRIYDFQGDSFCWGSFIIKENAPWQTAIESVLCVYDFAFYELGFKESHFDVRKENTRVIAFHKRFGAKVIQENALDYFFKLTLRDYEQSRSKYMRFVALDSTLNTINSISSIDHINNGGGGRTLPKILLFVPYQQHTFLQQNTFLQKAVA